MSQSDSIMHVPKGTMASDVADVIQQRTNDGVLFQLLVSPPALPPQY